MARFQATPFALSHPSREWLEVEDEIQELTERIDDLEAKNATLSRGNNLHAFSLVYTLGVGVAVTLSWIRNASILRGILHAVLSWVYVAYVAVKHH